jgi:hypothetical protein
MRVALEVVLRDEVLSLRAERDALRHALVEARAFAEWPAGSERLARVLQVIDAALALSQAP